MRFNKLIDKLYKKELAEGQKLHLYSPIHHTSATEFKVVESDGIRKILVDMPNTYQNLVITNAVLHGDWTLK